jgi:TPR repeat protein
VQTSLLAADSLAWSTAKYTFVVDLRQAVAEIPQQMATSLRAEFANTWHVTESALNQVERMLPAAAASMRSSTTARVDDCDRLAVHPLDREAGLPGVAMENIDIPRARAACERAVREHPKVGRYAFNYARIALAAGDTGSASRLMQQAASSNYILAQTYLGYAFLGQDAPFGQVEGLLHLRQNNDGAVRMFMKAALQGDLYGQAMLGWLFATGRGLRKSEAMARMWWGRAAANRDDRYENMRLYAEERLAELNAPGRGRR